MGYWLPFTTFGEAAAFDLEVEVRCQCRRSVIIDARAASFRDRPIMGARFRCTTILPDGRPCTTAAHVYIRRRGTQGMTVAEHSAALRARHAARPIKVEAGAFGSMVGRGEVAFLYDRGCVPAYTVDMIEFDLPPWDRFLAKPWGDFLCPGCRQKLLMHCHQGGPSRTATPP